LYNLVYTSLKKITALAILPGALVGAIPPLIGFVSAGGIIFSTKIQLFSTFIFLWQLPHFWLLSIRYGKEYQSAGFKSISNYLNEKQIRYLVFFWTMLSSSFILFLALNANVIDSNIAYFLIVLNLAFILLLFSLLFLKRKTRDIWSAFILFNSFGLLIMSVLIADSLLKGI
jgi:protoheme IX farnesyltransferase